MGYVIHDDDLGTCFAELAESVQATQSNDVAAEIRMDGDLSTSDASRLFDFRLRTSPD